MDLNYLKELEKFQRRLNAKPAPSKVQTQQNYSYLPISYIQNKLDELYFGQWETVNFRYQTVANEVIGSIELRVKHPITGEWLTRVGAASNIIRQQSGSDITDISKKIKSALEQDFPKLYTECIKNAAKQLGKIFGRDLNRQDATVAKYVPTVTTIDAILTATTIERLNEIAGAMPEIFEDHELSKALNAKKESLLCLPK